MTEVPKTAQDLRDGAALRRLREALPGDPSWWYQVVYDYDPEDIPSLPWLVFAGGPDDSMDEPKASGGGNTIAEAADKCREALR